MNHADASFSQDGHIVVVVRSVARKLMRHKLLFLTVASLITLAGVFVTLSLRPKYTALATVTVLPDAVDPLAPSAQEPQGLRDDEVATQARLLTALDLAQRVVAATGFGAETSPSFLARWPAVDALLCLKPFLPALDSLCSPGPMPDLQSRTAQFLLALTATPVPRTRVIELSLTTSSAAHAADALNSLIETFQQQQTAQRSADLARTAQWVSSRAEELRQTWLAAERRAGEFRAGNGLLSGGGGDGAREPLAVRQVEQATTALATAQSELAAARSRLGELNGSQDRLASIRLPEEPALISLAGQLVTLRAQRANFAANQGNLNPNVIAIDRQIAVVSRQLAAEQSAALGRLSADVRAKGSQVADAQRTLEQLRSGATDVTAKSVSLNTLDDEAKSARAVFEMFLARARQLDDRSNLLRPQIQVAAHARVPTKPSSPDVLRFFVGSIVFGLVSGSAAVMLREGFASGFTDVGRVAAQTGLPLICCIPMVQSRRERRPLLRLSARPTFSAVTEAMRTLAARIALPVGSAVAPQSVAIVSATSQEGKTTTALWLTAAIARSGRRVLLIDGDHRRGAVGVHLGDNTGAGLSEILFDGVDYQGCIKRERNALFDFISAGQPTARAFGAREVGRIRKLLENLHAAYDLVIIDTPPMLAMPEALLYATAAETNILLARWQSTAPQAVASCAERLHEYGAHVTGIALSMVDHDRLAQYSDEYSAHDLRMVKRFYITQ